MPGRGIAASLSGHRDCLQNNADRGRVQTGDGARRNRRLSPVCHSITHIIYYLFEILCKNVKYFHLITLNYNSRILYLLFTFHSVTFYNIYIFYCNVTKDRFFSGIVCYLVILFGHTPLRNGMQFG